MCLPGKVSTVISCSYHSSIESESGQCILVPDPNRPQHELHTRKEGLGVCGVCHVFTLKMSMAC